MSDLRDFTGKNRKFTSTIGERISVGTTAERDTATFGAGTLRYNSNNSLLEYYDGTAWREVRDLNNVITTQGDVLYRDGSGLARLAAGTSGQVLQTNGTGANPSWVDASEGKVLGSAVLFNSDTRVTFSVGSTNLTGDYYYGNSSNNYMEGSYTKQSATSRIMIWGHASYKFSTNSHGSIVYEVGSTTINNLQIDEHNFSRQYLSVSFSTVFNGMSTGSKTFRFVPTTGDARSHSGIRSMNSSSDNGSTDTPSHNGRCYMYLMEIEA